MGRKKKTKKTYQIHLGLDKGKKKSMIPGSFGKTKVNISKLQRGIFG